MSEIKDSYQTLEGPAIGEFRDRGSRFHAYAFPAYTEEECMQHLDFVKREHSKARHHCYAYRLGLDQNSFRANDDGEPSGTAGRPILGQIDSFGLTNTFVVVVRYFGGTLLGTSGLINAYKLSTADALNQAVIIERIVEDLYELTFEYRLMSNVMNAIKSHQLEMVEQNFEEIAKVTIAIRKGEVDNTLKRMKASIAEVYLEEVDELEKIDGFEIKYLSTR
ncbi:MAG: IMPACT family protein [Chitinophagales bacterium]|nr:IMPACT family protein [Chitinophagales bacterium]